MEKWNNYQVDSLPTENIMGEGGCEWYEYILWYMMRDAVVFIWLWIKFQDTKHKTA